MSVEYKQEPNRPNMVLVFQALARIVGNKCGCKITLESLTDKETGEVVYQREEAERQKGA